MSATGANINWTSVGWDSLAFKRITTAMFGMGASLLKFKGDTDIYPSIIACVDQEPHASIGSADVGTFFGCVPGVVGTLLATLVDAKAQTGGGCVFTASNAVFENADASAAQSQWSAITATWQMFASDGLTPPLVMTRV